MSTFNRKDVRRNGYMLTGSFAKKGYDWWWHSFTAIDEKTGEEVPFFIEFFLINPALSPDRVVLGQSEENKGKNRPCYLMIKCGCWGRNKIQLHKFIPLKDVKIHSCPIEIRTPEDYLSETGLVGHVNVTEKRDGEMSDLGEMYFNLKIEKEIAYCVGYGTSSLFRMEKAFEMYWHAQGMKSYYSGSILLNGRSYHVERERSYGYADKNWGSNFTTPWVWLSSNHIRSEKLGKELGNSVFDIGGGRPKAFHIRFDRKLLGAYYIEGKEYEYNFSKFLHPSKTVFDCKEKDGVLYWHVEQWNRKSKIVTDITCDVSDMLFVNYEAPDGNKPFSRLYNGGNGKGTLRIYRKKRREYLLLDTLHVDHVGCEYGEFDK